MKIWDKEPKVIDSNNEWENNLEEFWASLIGSNWLKKCNGQDAKLTVIAWKGLHFSLALQWYLVDHFLMVFSIHAKISHK